MAELVNVLLFTFGASLAGASMLALMPALQPDRHEYRKRVIYFLLRYCLPAVLLEEVVLRLSFGHFYP